MRTSFARNIGRLAPSHACEARSARRLSGGVVSTTYAAAAPADTITTFAIVRAVADVTSPYSLEPPEWLPPDDPELNEPDDDEPDGPRVLSEPLP